MRKLSFYQASIVSLLLILNLASAFVKPVSASHAGRLRVVGTYINLISLKDINIDEPFTLSGSIKDAYGTPLANKPIFFKIDGIDLGQARSDKSGNFQRRFYKAIVAGPHIIVASYKGTSFLAATSASTTLNILPSGVNIQTVPPISGIVFRINGQQAISDQNGFANIKMTKAGKYRLEVLLDQYKNPSQRVEFGRWEEESYQPYLDIQVPNSKVIQVGLNVYHLVGQSFVDLDGYPVDSQRIKEFTIKSAQGDVFVFQDGQPRWIPASRIARRVTGLEETKLLYSVIDVMVDGSNVVNEAQQRFYTHPNETWSISLLLYSLHISVKDGLFGSAVGQSINLNFPDGRIQNYPLNQGGTTDIHSLARGNYSIELLGTHGMASKTPVALSRNQDVNTKVITYLDLTVFGALGAMIALGLLLYGRPWLLYALLRKNRVAIEVSESILDNEPSTDLLPNEKPVTLITYQMVEMPHDNDLVESTSITVNETTIESVSITSDEAFVAADTYTISTLIDGPVEPIKLIDPCADQNELVAAEDAYLSADTFTPLSLINTQVEVANLTETIEQYNTGLLISEEVSQPSDTHTTTGSSEVQIVAKPASVSKRQKAKGTEIGAAGKKKRKRSTKTARSTKDTSTDHHQN